MKLHLPLLLLSAICLCYSAHAASVTTEDAEKKTITITGVSGDDGALTKFSDLMKDKDDYTIVFDMPAPSGGNAWYSSSETIGNNIVIGATDGEHGLRFFNGASAAILTFTGSVTGSGTISKAGASSANLIFTGDVHAFTGAIVLESSVSYGAEDTILFGGAGAVNASTATQGISGTGTITFKTNGDAIGYNYSTGSTVYITNAITTSGTTAQSKIRLEGTDDVVFTQSVNINTLEISSSEASVSFNGGGTIGNMTGTAQSIIKNAQNTLILTGTSGLDTQTFLLNQGTIQYKNSGGGNLGTVHMAAGTILSFYNTSNTSGNNKLIVNKLVMDGNATITNTYHAGYIQIKELTGTDKTLTLKADAATSQTQWASIDGGEFGGTVTIQQNNKSAGRRFVVVATNTTALADAVIDLNKQNSSGGLLAFGVGGAEGNTVNIAGLTGIASSYVLSTNNIGDINSLTIDAIVDGETRTLGLTGSGTYEYNGTIGSNLIIDKSGAGTQILHNISDSVTLNVSGGSLTLAGTVGNNVFLSAKDGTTVTKSGDGKLVLTELGDNATFNLENGALWFMGTLGTGSSIVTSAGTSVHVAWELAETTTGSGIFLATLPNADNIASHITGEGTILFDSIFAKGDTSYHPADRIFTRVDTTGYTGDSLEITGGLVSVITGDLATPGTLADFGTISTLILNGGGLVLNTEQGDFSSPFAKNIQIGANNGYVRSYQNSNLELSGAITGTGSLIKTDAGTVTLSGDMSGFSGGVIVGEGGLVFKTDATIASLQIVNTGDGAFVEIRDGKTLTIGDTSTVWTMTAGLNDIRLGEGSNVVANRIRFTETSTLNLTAASGTYGSMTLTGLQCADTGDTTINIGAGTALNLTGSNTGEGLNKDAFNAAATFLITHYNAHTDITVDGTFNMLNCDAISVVNLNRADSTITVNSGGVLNFKGLGVLQRQDISTFPHNIVVTLNAGGAMHLGSSGIDNNAGLVLNLNGGTVGILDSAASWSTERALVLGGDVTFDTRRYTAATDGQAGTYSETESGNIVLNGVLSGDGGIIKNGAGTLELGAANIYTGATQVNAGELKVTGSIGSETSSNTYSVQENATITLGENGSLANTGAKISTRPATSTTRDAAVPLQAELKNASFAETGIKRQSATGTGSVKNGQVDIAGPSAFSIENISLVNSLVTMKQACNVTLNNVTFDADSAMEYADGLTGGTVTMTGQSNTLTIGISGKTEIAAADATVSFNGHDYTNVTTTQLTGVQMDANGKLTIDITDSLLTSALNGGTYLAVTIDGFTAKDASFSANDFELSDHLQANVGTPTISGIGTSATGGTVVYIDFSQKQVPEPASSLLGLAGFAGLMLRRRRKA